MRLRSPSLFWTFAGAFLIVLVTATLLQGFVIVRVMNPLVEHWRDNRAELLVREAARQIEAGGSPDRDAVMRVLAGLPTDDLSLRLFFVDDGGDVFGASPLPRRAAFRLRRDLDRASGGGGNEETPPPGGPGPGFPGRPEAGSPPGGGEPPPKGTRPVILAHFPVHLGESGGTVIAWGPRRVHRLPPGPREGRRWPVLLFLPIAMLLAGAAGLVLFRLLTRRIRRLERLASRVAEGDLEARVDDDGADELGRLAAGLNAMTEGLATAREKLETGDRQRRRLMADISHELGTPLTSIRGYAETLLDPEVPVSSEERKQYLRQILDESRRMDLLIQDLLELGRLEGGAELHRERLDWAALCRNTMKRFGRRFRDAGLTLEWGGGADPVPVVADGRRLEQVIENLLVNALRYVPEGGTVRVTVETGETAGTVRLTVADDGPGIAPEALDHVFDRFYREDPARSTGGSGLGLAIVNEVARTHGGRAWAEGREPSGTAIHVALPAGRLSPWAS